MIRHEPRPAPMNQPYRPNFWATNVAYPTTVGKARIWLAIQDAMRVPATPTGGERS